MRVVCIALIGKNNEPKWTYSPSQDVQDENGLRFLYHAHTALDVIEEKIAAQKKAPKHPQHRDLFLGKLFAVEECLAFGFCANSHIKQVVILEEVTVRDALVKGWVSQTCKAIHEAYVAYLSNPFINPAEKIESASFSERVARAVKTLESKV